MSIHSWNAPNNSDPIKYLQRYCVRLNVRVARHSALRAVVDNESSDPTLVIPCTALVDTGAATSGIELKIAKKLGLEPSGFSTRTTADGPRMLRQFAFSIAFGKQMEFDVADGLGVDMAAAKIDAIIGMDILARCVLVVDGPAGKFSIQHRRPDASAHI